jgi:hypothetical protein
MNMKRAYKLITLAFIGLFFIITSGCKQMQVSGSYLNPYSKKEVVAMLSYHGAKAARFDGKRWFVFIGKKWIPLENGLAKKYASISLQRKKCKKRRL